MASLPPAHGSDRSLRDVFDARPYPFTLGPARLEAQTSGALWWPAAGALCVSDLHLGKSERLARAGGPLLPPYETTETLNRLSEDVNRLRPRLVICLGDSFDDARAAGALTEAHHEALARMMAGRRWVWIAGNHDPAPLDLMGEHLAELALDGLIFRHIAHPATADSADFGLAAAARGEVSGHFHPKALLIAQGRRLTRRCFVTDGRRAILPAYGAYTGGLDVADPVFDPLMGPEAVALLLGAAVRAIPRAALKR